MNTLVSHIKKVRSRMAIQQALHLCTTTLFFAVLGAILCTLLMRLFPVLGEPVPAMLVLGAVGLIGGLIYSISKRPTLTDAALEADRRAGLAERLLSSYQLAGVSGTMVDAVHDDALRYASRVRLNEQFSYKMPPELPKLAIGVLILGVVYGFMPEFDLFDYREKQAQALAVKQSAELKAKALTAVAKPLAEKKVEDPELAKHVQDMEKIAEQLRTQQITEKQALAKIQKLSEKLMEERQQLTQQFKPPHMKQAEQQGKQGSNELSKALSEGDYKKAAEKIREMAKKMKEGNLSEEDKAKMSQQLESLRDALSGQQSEMKKSLSEALSKLAENSNASNNPNASSLTQEQLDQLAQTALSMEDLASIMDQLDMTNMAVMEMAKWQNMAMGPSKFCRMCGMALKPCEKGEGCSGCGPGFTCSGLCGGCAGGGMGGMGAMGRGMWAAGDTSQQGMGMGGPGRGQGGEVGPLPDGNVGFTPEMLSGERTNGKILASLFEKSLPDENDEVTLDYVEGVFMEAQQDAEQALTKEEIPPGAKELVRQYFISIEPEQEHIEAKGEE